MLNTIQDWLNEAHDRTVTYRHAATGIGVTLLDDGETVAQGFGDDALAAECAASDVLHPQDRPVLDSLLDDTESTASAERDNRPIPYRLASRVMLRRIEIERAARGPVPMIYEETDE